MSSHWLHSAASRRRAVFRDFAINKIVYYHTLSAFIWQRGVMQCQNGHGFTSGQARWGVRERGLLCRPTGQRRAGRYQPQNCYHMHITRSLLLKWSEGTESWSPLTPGSFTSPVAVGWHPHECHGVHYGKLDMDCVYWLHCVLIFSLQLMGVFF